MRDRTEIERDIFHAREDLEQHLGALRRFARDKVQTAVRIERKALVIAGLVFASLVVLLVTRKIVRHRA